MIAWYVHDHGRGHLHRAAAVASRLDEPVLFLSRLQPPSGWHGPHVRLGTDVPSGPALDPTANDRLHWAPLGATTREHASTISTALRDHDVSVLVADVSVEVAVLARLHGVEVVVVAQRGTREDPAHHLGFDVARRIIAPWPLAAGTDDWPDRWRGRTRFVGGFSRFDGRGRASPTPRSVVVLLGAGGHGIGADMLAAAARATPTWRWTALGVVPDATDAPRPNDLRLLDWVEDPFPYLTDADVVVTHAGMNAVAEVAASRRPAVVVPMDRPFGEQRATATALADLDLAVVRESWPSPADWPAVLQRAVSRGGSRWVSWSDGLGADRAAAVVRDVAAGVGS